MKITKPGLQTTVQDAGRYGYQRYGVIVSGVMDRLAYRIGNMLVGNSGNEASLEMAMKGPEIEFEEEALISITGGDLSPTLDEQPIKSWRPIYVNKGAVLKFGVCASGCRAYLSVGGGIDVPEVMGSRSTYLRAKFGGHEGRAVQAEDHLSVGAKTEKASRIFEMLANPEEPYVESDWFSAAEWRSEPGEQNTIRFLPGREWDNFTKESQTHFTTTEYELTPQSDRMGFRFKGKKLYRSQATDMISEAVAFGTVQVPAEGQPIILLADRQTAGGYPKIAQIASVDLSKMVQLKPGQKIRFEKITHRDAEGLWIEQEKHLQQLEQGIALKLKEGSKEP